MNKDIQKCISYDLISGCLSRVFIKPRGRGKLGEITSLDKDGYMLIKLCSKNLKGHRVAWFLHYGEWPSGQIDHINGNRSDNRIDNLRVVTDRQNKLNMKSHREGRLFGAIYCSQKNSWKSRISINGKRFHLGFFNSETEAHEVYKNALFNYEKNNELPKKVITSKTGFYGVVFFAGRQKKYRAIFSGKTIGHFETALEAAKKYDEIALKNLGENAKLNFSK